MADNRRIPAWLKAQGYDKVPQYYKDLGLEAAESFLRMKKKGKSTKHWTLPFGEYKFVFFDSVSRRRVMDRLNSLRRTTGIRYPQDPVLNMLSLNKPINYQYRK